MLRRTLFTQLILLWSSSRSGTRGSTVVPAYLSPLHPPPLLSPISFPYARILLSAFNSAGKDNSAADKVAFYTSDHLKSPDGTKVKSDCEADITHY